MDKKEELMAEANCEICQQKEATHSVNIGLDVGYTIGKYGDTPIKIDYKANPICVAICSLYLCRDCEAKIKQKEYIYINVLPELKKLIKKDLIKQAIIEGLK